MLEKLTDWKYIALIIFLVIIGVSIPFLWNDELSKISSEGPFEENKVNILAVGYDDNINGPSRADTIILISLDIDTDEASVIFLPRDTFLQLDSINFTKLNSAQAHGGINLTQRVVEELLDIEVDYFLASDFHGFERIIDRLGGIEIEVERNLNYVDRAGGLYINIPAGRQNLDGENALKYVRYRDHRGDIGRIERQQKFIDAVLTKVLSPSVIPKIPGILQEINNAINTNIPFTDITPFLNTARNIDLNSIETVMLPGEPNYINGISYWVPNMEEAEIMIDSLVRSKSYLQNKEYQLTILNGVGEAGAASNTAKHLRKYGFGIDYLSNADHYEYENTVIKFFREEDEEVALQLAKLMGGEAIFEESEEEIDKEEIVNKIEVIVGQGYNDYI